MARERKRRGFKPFDGVASLAPIFMRRGLKLPSMRVRMAGRAGGATDLVAGLRAFRLVALCTGGFTVAVFQREAGVGVLGRTEAGGLKAIERVAVPAVAASLVLGKFSAVRIFGMAIGAPIVRNRSLEVVLGVTGRAGRYGMFSLQRKARFPVIENGGELGRLPVVWEVAAAAGDSEGPAVRIAVARSTITER